MGKAHTTPIRNNTTLSTPITPTSLPRSSDKQKELEESTDQVRNITRSISTNLGLNSNNTDERTIRSLPKRQRIQLESDEDDSSSVITTKVIKKVNQSKSLEGSKGEDEALEEIDSFGPVPISLKNQEASKEYRPDSNGYNDTTASKIPPPIITTISTISNHCKTCSEQNNNDDNFDQNEVKDRISSQTSLTSSSLELNTPATSPSSSINNGLKELETGSDYFPLFGIQGQKIFNTLSTASHFSSSGLLRGLSIAPSHERNNTGFFGTAGGEEEDEHEARQRFNDHRDNGRVSDVDVQLGNNKKKRKIPGVHRGPHGDDDDRAFDGDDEITESTFVDPQKTILFQRSDFATGLIHKASSPLPTTAKAALAKLHYRPPHISLARQVLSHRRFDRRYYRNNVALQKPLSLPTQVVYSAPTFLAHTPPPLPPGLKGSKAIKVAMKAEKEREKEKERIKLLLGGGKIKLINFWDPTSTSTLNGNNNNKPVVSKRRGVEVQSGYITPAASSDEGETSPSSGHLPLPTLLPTLDEFNFTSSAPGVIISRWNALEFQTKRFKVAKEGAAKAREEERERRKEKEKEAVEEAAVEAKNNNIKKSPINNSKRIPLAAPHPPVQSLETPSPTVTVNDPTFSPPSVRKPPPKKGRKKRSAHANAKNSHHINNFVPSRAPIVSHTNPNYNDSMPPPLTSWPASDEAIAAAEASGIRTSSNNSNGSSYFAGNEEWLCAFCEYEIFFGEESSLAKMIKQRKKVLKVRRRAKERAAKATNGEAVVPAA